MRAELPCLPLIQERFWNAIKDKLTEEQKKYYHELNMMMFKQTWGSTALGFGGLGGCAMTDAYTTVVIDMCSDYVGVFFGERIAYIINNPNETFYEDMRNRDMVEVSKSGIYLS